jgi:DNA repair protein RecO (recombination protein O)
MAIIETRAIVLETFKLADADKIVVCMTEKSGLVRGVARGARRLKSRFGASLEPFTLIWLTYFEKESRELVAIRDAEILASYFGASRDTQVAQALGYLSEIVREFAPPSQADEKLFRMLRACIDATARRPELLQAITVYAELWALKLTGLLAEARECGACGRRLSPEVGHAVYISAEGALRCHSCRRNGWQRVEKGAHGLLKGLQTFGPERWAESYRAASPEGREFVAETARRLVNRALERETRANRVLLATQVPAPAA